jgi:putative redox protein
VIGATTLDGSAPLPGRAAAGRDETAATEDATAGREGGTRGRGASDTVGRMSRIRSAVLTHWGGMRFEAATGTGRAIVFGDDPDAGELSPVETVVAALAACSAMDVVSILEKKRQVITSYEIEVSGDQRDDYPQVYTRVDVTHVLEGTVLLEAAVRRAIELSASKYCPVNAMISAGATEVHHAYRMRCTGAEPIEASGEVIVTGPERLPTVVA